MASPLVRVQIRTEGLAALGNPALFEAGTKAMVQAAVDAYLPRAKAEAPKRSGRSQQYIRGIVDRIGDRWVGRVRAMGRGFYLTILAVGVKGGTEITPFRARSRRGRSRSTSSEFITPEGMVVTTRGRGGFASLRFMYGGETLFRRRVTRGDIRANPWLERAAQTGAAAAGEAMDRTLQAVLDRAR